MVRDVEELLDDGVALLASWREEYIDLVQVDFQSSGSFISVRFQMRVGESVLLSDHFSRDFGSAGRSKRTWL